MGCLRITGVVRFGFEKEWNHSRVQSNNISFGKFPLAPRRLAFLHFSPTNITGSDAISRVKYPGNEECSSLQDHWGQHSQSSLSTHVSLNEEAPLSVPEESSEELLPQKPDSEQLKALLLDSERRRLIRKLSEANQHNRFLKRQILVKDDDLVNIRIELAILELEIQALVELAQEVANYGIQPGSRKINGKYVQSHLVSRLQVAREKIKKQIKDVDAVKFREITVSWIGMAESVQVMGSFDGWSQGEDTSQEYTGTFIKFSANLKLRPGRYEVKFLVDGEWQLSPELPTVGEGVLKNNLLIVE